MLSRLALPAVVTALAAGCAAPARSGAGGPLHVVAAESLWGSIAAQLGGDRVQVTSVIANPAADPHDYEPTAADARALADAQLVIVNGAGYDAWAQRLLAANPVRGRIVVDVGRLAGVKAGGNPHLWYAPAAVRRTGAAIARAYAGLDATHAAAFARLARRFETAGLARYDHLVATIRRRFGGLPVGASESMAAPLAQALGLRLITPPAFLKAMSEGTEPSAADTSTVHRQVARRQIRVWIVDTQNSTPDVARLTAEAHRAGIPVTAITETLAPASATFQAWQTRQLAALLLALAKGVAG